MAAIAASGWASMPTEPWRILITGGSGQVGTELQRIVWPADVTLVAPDRQHLNLADPSSITAAFAATNPDLVINSGAFTAVDRAETEVETAMAVNGSAPELLARLCATRGIALIHLSTDYVFDGSKDGAYGEDDPTAPLNIYGRSKLAGEAAIRATLSQHVILRTSWVYAGHGANFVRTMLRLGQEREELSIVADQHGCPTWAGDLARAIATIALRIQAGDGVWGTFHLSGANPTTWYDFASEIFSRSAGKKPRLKPIATSAYPTPARRPLNSVLDCGKIAASYGIHARPWRDALAEMLART